MNLELTNLTDEQKQQIIELAKKFEQENEVDKLDCDNDWTAGGSGKKVTETGYYLSETAMDFFDLGLTAHTKEEAEKIRRRLLVEKELRDWAKKCKEPVDWKGEQEQYYIEYDARSEIAAIGDFFCCFPTNIIFADKEIAKQAIKSIGQERLIRDYFGIE